MQSLMTLLTRHKKLQLCQRIPTRHFLRPLLTIQQDMLFPRLRSSQHRHMLTLSQLNRKPRQQPSSMLLAN